MRRTLTLCRTALVGAAAVALLTACGGGDSEDSAASSSSSETTSSSAAESSSEAPEADSEFCQQAGSFLEQIQGADLNTEDPTAIGDLLTSAAQQMRAIEAPGEIAGDWTALADAIEQLGTAYNTTDFSDPEQATAFSQTAAQLESQLTTASTNVETYLSDQCGISTGDTASPTS
ncbi:hypothetical protein ACI797_10925 [Geodermatophilus sp. SYSU D00691]